MPAQAQPRQHKHGRGHQVQLDQSFSLCLQYIVHHLERIGQLRPSGDDAQVEEFGSARQRQQERQRQRRRRRQQRSQPAKASRRTEDDQGGHSGTAGSGVDLDESFPTFALRTSTERLLLRTLDMPRQDDGQASTSPRPARDARATANLMTYLHRELSSGSDISTSAGPNAFSPFPASAFRPSASLASPSILGTSSRLRLRWKGEQQQQQQQARRLDPIPVPKVVTFKASHSDGLRVPWILLKRPEGELLDDVLSAQRSLADGFQDWCELARALARLQASIWNVRNVPGWGLLTVDENSGRLLLAPDGGDDQERSPFVTADHRPSSSPSSASLRRIFPSHSEGSAAQLLETWALVPTSASGSVGSSPTISASPPSTDGRFSTYAWSYARSTSCTAGSSTVSSDSGSSGSGSGSGSRIGSSRSSVTLQLDSLLSDTTESNPLSSYILGGLLQQRQQALEASRKHGSGSETVERLDRLIDAAEILLDAGTDELDGDGDAIREHSERCASIVQDQQQEQRQPKFVLSLPQLGPHNIFVDKRPMVLPDFISRRLSLTPSSSSAFTSSSSAAPPSFRRPTSQPTLPSSFAVTGLLEVDMAEGEPAAVAYLSAMSSNSLWAQLLWERPTLSEHAANDVPPSAPPQPGAGGQDDRRRPSKKKRRTQGDGSSLLGTQAAPLLLPAVSSGTWPTSLVATSSHDLDDKDDEEGSDAGFEFASDFDLDEGSSTSAVRRHKASARHGSSRAQGPQMCGTSPTLSIHQQHQVPPVTQSSTTATVATEGDRWARDRIQHAFFTELSRRVPGFEQTYRSAMASKISELLRLATGGCGGFHTAAAAVAVAEEEDGREGAGCATWVADERAVLCAAAERERGRMARLAVDSFGFGMGGMVGPRTSDGGGGGGVSGEAGGGKGGTGPQGRKGAAIASWMHLVGNESSMVP
ncbi:hypothetical protein OC844_003629 [Tilletia horrida]|nr:hypothetical protein OC844_003629 [Tilletia horrida]